MLGVPGIEIPNLSRTSRHFYNFMGVPNEPSGFRFSLDLNEKMMRGGFLDLPEAPVLRLKDNEAHLIGIQQKIWFLTINFRKVPAEVVGIRLRHSLEELVEGPFPPCFKLPDITGHHRSHRYPFNTLNLR